MIIVKQQKYTEIRVYSYSAKKKRKMKKMKKKREKRRKKDGGITSCKVL